MLEAIGGLSEAECPAAGWTIDEVDSLERIAGWEVEGVPYGDWIAAEG